MIVTKTSGSGGMWLDKKDLENGDKLVLVTEADFIPSQQGGEQLVAKCKVHGKVNEPSNIAINAPSKNALIDAFGADTADWRNKDLTVNVEKTLIAGKRGIAVYLIPEGFELAENADGYLNITRKEDTEDITDLPF